MAYQPHTQNKISTLNSTSTPLNSGATFTGSSEDIHKWDSIAVRCKTDQDGTLEVTVSTDGTNFDLVGSYPVKASVPEAHRLTVTGQYLKVSFTNTSASNQTYLRLEIIKGKHVQLSRSLNSVIQANADTLITTPIDFNLAVANSRFNNREFTVKDGINFDVDSGSVPEDVWSLGGAYTGFVSTPAASEVVVAGADTGTVYYAYMASSTDLDYTFGTIAVTGAGTYSLGHNIWRCNFAYFQNSGGAINVSDITIRHTAVPANIFCVILANYGQTYCGAYTVPYKSSIYIDRFTATVRGLTSASLDGFMWYRPNGGSPTLRFPFEAQFGALFFDDMDYAIRIPELVDIVPRITSSSANNIIVKCSYRLIKIKE